MSATQYSPESLESLLKGLSLSDNGSDHEQILRHADSVLKSSQGNSLALHTKVVALLNLDRHEDAYKVFTSPQGQKIADVAVLEHAYCLYKVGKLEETVELVRKADVDPQTARALKHIAAQAYYRLENFVEVSKLLKNLSETPYQAPNEDGDLRVNIAAADAQLAWSGHGHLVAEKKTAREDLDVFEATFNAACLCIASNKFGQAAILLKRARQLCQDLEDLTPEEKEVELEPVIVQEIYLLARTGQLERAKELAANFDTKSVSDEAVLVVATINKIAIESQAEDFNPYAAYNSYIEATKNATSLAARPFGFQSKIIRLDEAVLNLNIGKTNATEAMVKGYHKVYPSDHLINVVQAAAGTVNKTGKDIIKKIEKLVEANPADIGLAFTLVQLRMQTGNITGSITTLESLLTELEPQARYQPGLVGLLVALYEHQGRKQHVRKILSEASEWWKQSPQPNLAVLRAAGKSKLESDSPSELASAGEIFTSLLAANPADRNAVAGLVASYATTDLPKVSSYADTLTPVETLIAGVDVDSLESAGAAQPPKKRGAEDGVTPPAKPRKTRKHKSRLPQNYDATKKPDPERWLPMRDRSYYKPKGRKGKQKAAAATQGGPVEESMELAGGGRIDVVKVDQAQAKKAGGGGGGANKKKKKKGGKW
ncbi:hypothetical protein FN846DRAFT_1009456 [Sphaerosporella brunnea]|uniref:Signal recognition particle subunit SRP72 n=1 Tax=Sphaerosporella brunnea TaxID=1250544 RepID=A0A5J5F0V8_9PEZI|nr:hypothetical protein FN846DRAFT_1009456 [Sphaerosporella brunnea]